MNIMPPADERPGRITLFVCFSASLALLCFSDLTRSPALDDERITEG